MSGRTVSSLTLAVALLLSALAVAQEGGFQTPVNSDGSPPTLISPVAPVASPPKGTVEAGPGVRIMVPALGPVGLQLDTAFPVTKGPNDHRQVFNFAVGLFGSQADAPPTCPRGMTGGCGGFRTHIPAQLLTAVPPTITLADVGPIPPASPAFIVAGPGTSCLPCTEFALVAQPTQPTGAASPLLGTWYREVPGLGVQVVVTFTRDELKLCVTHSADGRTVTITATAHYTVTPDGLVYGAITGVDVGTKSEPKAAPANDESVELALIVQSLVDAPFSCRTKATSAGLMVSGVKCGGPVDSDAAVQTQLAFGGLFKSAKDSKVPAPVTASVKARLTGGKCDGGCDPSSYPIANPKGGPIGSTGVDVNTNPPTMNPPAQPMPCPSQPAGTESFGPPFLSKIPYLNQLYQNVGPTPPSCVQPARPVQPGVSEDGTKQLAQDAFSQLLQQSGVTRPAGGATGGVTLPSPRYLEHPPQYFAPDPAFPLPRELAAQEASGSGVRPASVTVPVAPTKAIPVGTWYRDVAGKQCVVKVAPDHMTFTVHDAQEVDGKVSVASLIITADYHTSRDGLTAVGLITNVDVNFEGEFPPEDTKPFFEMLTGLQKALEDKPFALTFRVHGEALVLGNVRMPTGADYMDVQPSVYVAGRYKAAGDKLPKLKPVKMPIEPKAFGPNGAPLLSGPSAGPAFGAPGQPLPPGSAYPSIGSPSPPPLPSSNGDLLPPQQIPSAPPTRVVPSGGTQESAPPMPQPTKPVPQMPQPTPPPGYYESEDIKQLKNEWRRFWNNDRPSHLTPERIHGGIY